MSATRPSAPADSAAAGGSPWRAAAVSAPALAAVAGFLLAGSALRLWNLRNQVMGDDGLHAVRAVASSSVREILSEYSLVDYSLPITALHRVLFDLGLDLSEMHFRLPAILCGLLALALLPLAFAGRLDRSAVHLLGWLVALSPSLVLYSRIGRSYLPMVLLAFGAVMAFERWWSRGSLRAAAAYVVLGALAVWVHLGAGPIVAAPFLFAVADVVRTRTWARAKEILALGASVTLAVWACLAPAASSLVVLVASKHMDVEIPARTWLNLLILGAGTHSVPFAALFWIAAAAGLLRLLRRQPRLGAFTLTVAAGHVAGILLLSPAASDHPQVLHRYLLPVLPFVLLWVAVALGTPWPARFGAAGGWLQRGAAGLLLLGLLWTGPFAQPGFLQSSFMHHDDFIAPFRPLRSIPPEALPDVYRELPDGPVLECPWPTIWLANRSYYAYQRIHGQRVLVSSVELPRVPGIELRNEVRPTPGSVLESPARTLVVHLDLHREESRTEIPEWELPLAPPPEDLLRVYPELAEDLAFRFRAAWGEPDWADGEVEAWDLDRVRREQAEEERASERHDAARGPAAPQDSKDESGV